MATQTGSKCRLCRREGEKLYLKGEKCFTVKCPIVSRNYIPGQHGPTARKPRLSEFGMELREKQKVKRTYGIFEIQFRRYVEQASKNPNETGDVLLRLLEQRLDNVVYRLGFAPSRNAARQMVSHGNVVVNGKTVNVPSYHVSVGDTIECAASMADNALLKSGEELMKKRSLPEWLSREKTSGKVETIPDVASMKQLYNLPLIVEFYSR